MFKLFVLALLILICLYNAAGESNRRVRYSDKKDVDSLDELIGSPTQLRHRKPYAVQKVASSYRVLPSRMSTRRRRRPFKVGKTSSSSLPARRKKQKMSSEKTDYNWPQNVIIDLKTGNYIPIKWADTSEPPPKEEGRFLPFITNFFKSPVETPTEPPPAPTYPAYVWKPHIEYIPYPTTTPRPTTTAPEPTWWSPWDKFPITGVNGSFQLSLQKPNATVEKNATVVQTYEPPAPAYDYTTAYFNGHKPMYAPIGMPPGYYPPPYPMGGAPTAYMPQPQMNPYFYGYPAYPAYQK